MKILMVTHYFSSHGGGIELVAHRMFQGLGRPGCRVLWAAADASAAPGELAHSSSLPLESWNRLEGRTGVPFPVPTLRALKKLRAAVHEADVLLLHDCLYLSNIAAYLLAWLRGIPVIVIQHIGIVPYRNPLLRGLMQAANVIIARTMLAVAHQVVFISENTKRYFQAVRFSKPPVTIFNGVDCRTFRPLHDKEDKQKIRKRLELPTDKPVALFVGRFVPKKGMGVLREMAARDPNISWALAGTGPINPGEWRLSNVRVYSNLRDQGLAELYRASDVFVLPSTGEGFPLVLQEALASGLSVICGAEASAADAALKPFLRGVDLLPGNDERSADSFLAAIHDALATSRAAGTAQRQHEFIRARYSWQEALNRYFEMLSALLRAPQLAASKTSRELGSGFAAANNAAQGNV